MTTAQHKVPYRFAVCRVMVAAILATLLVSSGALHAQDKVVVIRHGSTPEGDVTRARAEAVLALRLAELVGEKALAQRLENLIGECDVWKKRFATRDLMQQEATADRYEHTFDLVRFNQQLANIRAELQQDSVMQRTRIGDSTKEMNYILEKMARQSECLKVSAALATELSPEQLDSIYLTDGSNTFSATTGKTRLETFRWPFLLRQQAFQEERAAFESLCDEAVKEMNTSGAPSPETIMGLLKILEPIDRKVDSMPISENLETRSVEAKWRKEAKGFLHELARTLGDSSRLEAKRLSAYVFNGKTLGEMIVHMNTNGLRFAAPNEEGANLYASVFFLMRYAIQDRESPRKEEQPQPHQGNEQSSANTVGVPAARQQEKPKQGQEDATPAPSDSKIVEGVGWKGVRVGATRAELVNELGPPDPESKDHWLQWKSRHHVHCLVDDDRGAFELRFDQGFTSPLSTGVRIGSSEKEVLASYGKPDQIVEQGSARKLEFSNRGVLFWVKDGIVSQIVIFAPRR